MSAELHAPSHADAMRHIAGLIRQLALQRDLFALSAVAADGVAALVGGDRATCLLYSASDEILWSEQRPGSGFHHGYGLAGAAARLRCAQFTLRAGADPRYFHPGDDPTGTGSERLLCQPIVAASGEVHGVAVVARTQWQPPFGERELWLLGVWAQHAATVFHAHHLEAEADDAPCAALVGPGIFRPAALAARDRGERNEGPALLRPPRWASATYWVLLVFVAVAGAYVSLARVPTYASGPAIVVGPGHHEITASRAGVVATVLASPGDEVAAGQPVARLHGETEKADLERARRDFEHQLEARLRSPADREIQRAVSELEVELERAEARYDATLVRATANGVIGDVHVAAGQAVEAGDVVMALDTRGGTPMVRSFVPSRYRPGLATGQDLVLDLDGFEHASQRLRVDSVGAEALGPAQIRRLIGPRLADALEIEGAVVMVEATLPDASIEVDGRRWPLHDGMTGRAHVAVVRKRVIFALFPDLEDVLTRD